MDRGDSHRTYGTKDLGAYQMVGGYKNGRDNDDYRCNDKEQEISRARHAMAYEPCAVPHFDVMNSPMDNKISSGR